MNANAFDDTDPRQIESWALDRDFDRLTDEERDVVLRHLGSRDAYERLRLSVDTLRATLAAESRELAPDPAIRESLHTALDRRKQATPRSSQQSPERSSRGPLAGLAAWLGGLLSRPVPFYQSALGAAAVAGLALVLIPRGSGEQTVTPRAGGPDGRSTPAVVERIVRVPVHDTVTVSTIDETMLARIRDSVREEVRGMLAAERRSSRLEEGLAREPRSERRQERSQETEPEKQEREIPWSTEPTGANRFVGLANLSQLDVQRRGKSLTEDSAYRQFSVTLP